MWSAVTTSVRVLREREVRSLTQCETDGAKRWRREEDEVMAS